MNTCDNTQCTRRMLCFRYRVVIDPNDTPWVDRWIGGIECDGYRPISRGSAVVSRRESDERRKGRKAA